MIERTACPPDERRSSIQMAVLAALMHVKPDYRSPARLDECAGVIADFVEATLADEERVKP